MIFTTIFKIINLVKRSVIGVVGHDVLLRRTVSFTLGLVEGAEPRHVLLHIIFGLVFDGLIARQVLH